MTKAKPAQHRADHSNFDVMLPQNARSHFNKAVKALDMADDLLPDDALTGTSAALNEAARHLDTARENLARLMVYRKLMGVG